MGRSSSTKDKKVQKTKKRSGYIVTSSSGSGNNLFHYFRRGNITLTRLLIMVNSAGPDGIATMQLFRELGSTGYGQTTLRRAVKQGLIQRKQGEPPGPGQFPPIFNILTKKGKDLLLRQFIK